MVDNLIIFFFGNLVEAFLIVFIALSLFKVKVSLQKMILMAGLYAVSVVIVRKIYTLLEIPFGTHTLILLLIATIIVKYVGKTHWLFAFPGVITPFILIMSGSPIAYKIIMLLGWENQELIFSNPWRLLVAIYSEIIYLFVAAFILKITKFNVPALISRDI